MPIKVGIFPEGTSKSLGRQKKTLIKSRYLKARLKIGHTQLPYPIAPHREIASSVLRTLSSA